MSQSTENLTPGASAKYSDLDAFSESYHLVVGVTEASINTMVKQRIKWDENPEKTIWYKAGSPVAEIAPISGIDPFNPDAVNADQLKQLQDAGFAFAVKTGNGPGGPRPLPEIMDLKDANSAIFNLYFTHFSLVQLKDGKLNVQSQPDDNFWIFSYDVSLNLSSASFSDLTPEQQAAVKNIAPESALSVDQLLLDFNTLSAKSQPNVGVDDWNPVLQKFIEDHYLADLKNREAITLSRQVKKTGSDGNSTLVPTDIQLGVSQYLDGAQQRHETSPLSTLNYLMATKNATLPSSFNQFTWNWINSDEANDANGCMAISRKTFSSILKNVLDPLISPLCLQPRPTISYDIVNFKTGVSYEQAGPWPLDYVEDGSKILIRNAWLEGKDTDGDGWDPRPNLLHKQTYSLHTAVSVEKSQITIWLNSVLEIHLEADLFNAGGVDGTLADRTFNAVYDLSINSQGQLSTVFNEAESSKTYKEPHLDKNLAASIDGTKAAADNMGGRFDHYWEVLRGNVAADLNNALKNSAQFFVFPGGNTFTFSSPFFSDHQDLITQITYRAE